MTTVFGHPGRRFGTMAEALTLVLGGTLLGVAWSALGIYLGSLVIPGNPSAAYAIRGGFLAIAVMVHGFLRSGTPRLFILVLLLIIVSVVSLTSTATAVTPGLATQILYPVLLAAGVIVLVNLSIFPEFSSSFLGQMTIETLNDTSKALEDAGRYFTYTSQTSESESIGKPEVSQSADHTNATKGDLSVVQGFRTLDMFETLRKFMNFTHGTKERSGNTEVSNPATSGTEKQRGNAKPLERTYVVSLSALTTAKGKLRTKLSSCRAAQRECNFEVAISVLPPQSMKPISVLSMKKLVANTVAIIGACESRYALLGGFDVGNGKPNSTSQTVEISINSESEKSPGRDQKANAGGLSVSREKAELDYIKPRREIEFGDVQLLRYLLETVTDPYQDLQAVITRTVDVVSACIAYSYVRTLPLHHSAWKRHY